MFSAGDELEILKSILPFSFLFFLPLFIVISPVSMVGASHEFQIHRMHQYDLQGISHGCRSTHINLEARSLSNWSTQRHCVITRFEDITLKMLSDIKQYAGGLLIILPRDVTVLSQQEKQLLGDIETQLLKGEVNLPIYFSTWSPEFEVILRDVENSKLTDEKAPTAWDAILNSVSANGYQVVVSANKATPKVDSHIISIQGKLAGYGLEDKLPTIAIVAYYDSFGVSPELSFGTDNNGSGVIMLLELVRIFSYLYASSRAHARVNILFLLSGGGKLNYQGSKKWLEDQLDGLEGSLIQDAMYVLCLDAVGASNNLNVHVSKPPKERSPAAQFLQDLKSAHENVTVEVVHKKINLAEDFLAWEHERYSIRRLPAFTLSTLKSYKDPARDTIFDTVDSVDAKKLAANIEALALALARQIYNITALSNPLNSHISVDPEFVKTWMDFLTSQPRAPMLLSEKNNPLIKVLQDSMHRYLKDTKTIFHTADKRDPEFVFYDVTKATVYIYNVKPAVFDLFLMVIITLYLSVIYLIVQASIVFTCIHLYIYIYIYIYIYTLIKYVI
ncbi:hypothetical protein AAG570_008025 [Ranatra chinensis]|uniref:BOS complex subunit NCLN n=1 Tax=Ranatra chinensis TaxID=642074 RepID=A0ABD0XTJ2_9HEMI